MGHGGKAREAIGGLPRVERCLRARHGRHASQRRGRVLAAHPGRPCDQRRGRGPRRRGPAGPPRRPDRPVAPAERAGASRAGVRPGGSGERCRPEHTGRSGDGWPGCLDRRWSGVGGEHRWSGSPGRRSSRACGRSAEPQSWLWSRGDRGRLLDRWSSALRWRRERRSARGRSLGSWSVAWCLGGPGAAEGEARAGSGGTGPAERRPRGGPRRRPGPSPAGVRVHRSAPGPVHGQGEGQAPGPGSRTGGLSRRGPRRGARPRPAGGQRP